MIVFHILFLPYYGRWVVVENSKWSPRLIPAGQIVSFCTKCGITFYGGCSSLLTTIEARFLDDYGATPAICLHVTSRWSCIVRSYPPPLPCGEEDSTSFLCPSETVETLSTKTPGEEESQREIKCRPDLIENK